MDRAQVALERLAAWGTKCSSCPFAKDGKPHKPVLGEGPTNATGVLIGEGPGAEEQEVGRPFVGATGRELDNELTAAKLERRHLYILNATCCRPPPEKNEAMMAKAVACCAPAFKAQLPPQLPAFVMGKHAWVALAGKVPKGGLNKGRGFLRKTADGRPYIATWHPTFAFFRNPYEWGAFSVDLGRFARMLKGKLRPQPRRLVTGATWRDIRRLVRQGGHIGVDDETAPMVPSMPWTGKDPTRARLKTVGLGNEEWGLSVLWELADARTKEAVRLACAHVLAITFNGQWFDHRVHTRYGIPFNRWEDARSGTKAVSTTRPLNLAYNVALYDDAPPWKEGDEDDDKGIVYTDDLGKLMRYNAEDAVRQARLWGGLLKEPDWQTPRVQKLYQLHKRLGTTAGRMHTKGIYVDDEARGELASQLAKLAEEREAELAAVVGIPAFTGTDNDIRALLFKRHETAEIRRFSLPDPWDDNHYTEGGDISVARQHLLKLYVDPDTPEDLRKILDLHWRANAPSKALSTFVASALVDQAIGDDGRLRPGWNSAAADTWRWTCSEPNIQTLSEKKDD